jgi:hypothetical protein
VRAGLSSQVNICSAVRHIESRVSIACTRMQNFQDNQSVTPSAKVVAAQQATNLPVILGGAESARRVPQLLWVVSSAVVIVAIISHCLAGWLGFPPAKPAYRRIGPESGRQVYCAGSSLLQFGLSWEEVSKTLGEGIENWGVAGSSPSEWEALQTRETNANLLLIGVSLYDMNESRLCDNRADIVSITQTIRDLFQSHSGWQFSKRVLSQYPLSYLRHLFPTAGRSEEVLVGLRMKTRQILRMSEGSEDRARVAFLPSGPVLKFGESKNSVADWDPARAIRRVSGMREDNHGTNLFNGPKNQAFQRMLRRARMNGTIIVVVLPASPMYVQYLVSSGAESAFEDELEEARRAFPEALFVRLDHVPRLKSNACFADLVHLNSAGRAIATDAFLKDLKRVPARL